MSPRTSVDSGNGSDFVIVIIVIVPAEVRSHYGTRMILDLQSKHEVYLNAAIVDVTGLCLYMVARLRCAHHVLTFNSCLGSNRGEAHPRQSPQSLHRDAGLRLPDQD